MMVIYSTDEVLMGTNIHGVLPSEPLSVSWRYGHARRNDVFMSDCNKEGSTFHSYR